MQHLLDALEEAQKNAQYLPHLPRDIRIIEQYIRTGDAALVPAVQAIRDDSLWSLRPLSAALPAPDQWSEADRRAFRCLAARSPMLFPKLSSKRNAWESETADRLLHEVIESALQREPAIANYYAKFVEEIADLGVPEKEIARFTTNYASPLAANGTLTSAGRFLVGLDPQTMATALDGYNASRNLGGEFLELWMRDHRKHTLAVASELVAQENADGMPPGGWILLLDTPTNEALCALAFHMLRMAEVKFLLGCRLDEIFPGKYAKALWEAAPGALVAALGAEGHAAMAKWMLQRGGVDAVLPLRDYLLNWNPENALVQEWEIGVLNEAVRAVGSEARPVIHAAMQPGKSLLRRAAISALIGLHDPADAVPIAQALDRELSAADSDDVIAAIPIAMEWDAPRYETQLWALLSHKSKPVREAAVSVLSKLGESAVTKGIELLGAKKSDTRISAAALLGKLKTPIAIEALRAAVETEKSDSVADAIRTALGSAEGGEATAPTVSRAAMETVIRKNAPKAKIPAEWLTLETLPKLFFADGTELGLDGTKYLLFRQSRCKTIEADAEARPLYTLLDRAKAGDFALAIVNGFLASGADAADRWALAIAGLLGDERMVPLLTKQVQLWADSSRGKLAEYAVHALALQASDPALLAVDALATRYRTKYKNIGKAAAEAFNRAADARGLSPAELGDRVIPWLGFTPGQPRILSWGDQRFELSIGLDFKPAYRDVTKNKRVASLPGSAPAEIKAEVKELTAGLKEAIKAQHLRLENLMVQQHRWPAARWNELFLQHPLLIPFAARLVWGEYDSDGKLIRAFRALEDRTLTDAADTSASLPAAQVGIVHPLELEAGARSEWLQHLADYDIASPFPQLERAVIAPPSDQRGTTIFKNFEKTELNAMTFRGRAEKRGWVRGSVVDAGGVPFYYKPFASAGVDVFLYLDGMYVGIDLYSSITLGNFFFVRHGSVEIGSYTYDEPTNEKDPRLVAAGEIPPIAYSEALGDLQHIAGKGAVSET